jgi:hypothetical protein
MVSQGAGKVLLGEGASGLNRLRKTLRRVGSKTSGDKALINRAVYGPTKVVP